MSERPAVLVTGGASGIGRATVERFLATGWDVVAADLNLETGEVLVAALEAQGYHGRIDFVSADVSAEADVEAAVSKVPARYGRLDCVDGGVIAAGPRIGDKVGGDPAARGLVGVARGSTGQAAVVRRRL